MKHWAATAVLVAAAAAGCAAVAPSDVGSQNGELRPVERKIIGAGVAFDADPTLRAQTDDLQSSMKDRRAAAWKALAKVLKPVAIADQGVAQDGGTATLPVFRTWYGKDDFQRLFGQMYSSLTPADRKARRAFTQDEITKGIAANAADQGSWTADDYLARVKAVTDPEFLEGLGGNSRVSYSPGFITHMLGEYKAVDACLPKLAVFGAIDAPPPSDVDFTQCFSQEAPIDAALVKAAWWRADFGMTVPTYDTGADSLAQRRAGTLDQGGWGTGIGTANPDDAHIYTVKTSDGNLYRMAGMHLATKELREWQWITTWWSDSPDTDFGADRPDEMRALGGPWANYKMCVVSGYQENDEDPRGGFDGSLGDALAAVHEGKGGATWCANPYVEKGDKNAQTNCIGCHQHAGTPNMTSASILADEVNYPKSGRIKLRTSFPADYVWSFDAQPDFISRVVEAQVTHFDSVDPR